MCVSVRVWHSYLCSWAWKADGTEGWPPPPSVILWQPATLLTAIPPSIHLAVDTYLCQDFSHSFKVHFCLICQTFSDFILNSYYTIFTIDIHNLVITVNVCVCARAHVCGFNQHCYVYIWSTLPLDSYFIISGFLWLQVVLCFEIQYLGKHGILGLNDKYHKDALSFDFEATGQKTEAKWTETCVYSWRWSLTVPLHWKLL